VSRLHPLPQPIRDDLTTDADGVATGDEVRSELTDHKDAEPPDRVADSVRFEFEAVARVRLSSDVADDARRSKSHLMRFAVIVPVQTPTAAGCGD